MIRQEWKKLRKNYVLLIVMIAVLLIPTIYTTLFLGSMWDPYGKLDQLPVAIVNKDQAAEYNGKEMNVGEELVKKLREEKSLAFNFVEEAAAIDGLENGTFYMAIVIPEDFTKNAATLMNDEPQKMELKCETNPGKNYIASKMSDSALTKIKNSISQTITKEYAQAVFDKISQAGDGMQEAADGADKIDEGVNKAGEGNKEVTGHLKTLASSSLIFKEGSTELKRGIEEYASGAVSADEGAKQVSAGVETFSDSVLKGVSPLTEGTQSLSKGTNTLYSGTQTLDAGVSQADLGAQAEAEGAKGLVDGSKSINGGAVDLDKGAKSLANGIKGVNDGANQLSQGFKQTMAGADQLKNGMEQLEAYSDPLAKGAEEFGENLNNLDQLMQSISINTDDLDSLIAGSNDFLTALKTAASLSDGFSTVDAEGSELLNGQNFSQRYGDLTALVEQYEKINQGMDVLEKDISGLYSSVGSVQAAAGDLNDGYKKRVQSGITAYTDTFEQIANGYQPIYDGISQLSMGADSLLTGTKTLDSGSENLSQGTGLLVLGTDNLVSGAEALSAGAASLKSGTSALKGGTADLLTGSKNLTEGAETLDTGAQQLSSGLKDGVEQLKSGTGALSEGLQTLVDNNSSLLSGSSKLDDGASQISDGAGQIYGGSLALGDGIQQIAEGTQALDTSLSDGAQKIKETKTTEKTVEMFAAPVQEVKTQAANIENNGHAMAAYMMSVALWVGCIAFSLMYPLTKYSGKLKSGFAWWASKATVLAVLAILQAVIMVFLLNRLNHFEPKEMGMTVFVACLASLAFMSIVYFFNICLGKVGSFLMLIFMVVQLAGSAGTYPVEISGSFVARIHKYLPFTYTVDAFRSTIAGGTGISHQVALLIAIVSVFTLLTILFFQRRVHQIKQDKASVWDRLERTGLLS